MSFIFQKMCFIQIIKTNLTHQSRYPVVKVLQLTWETIVQNDFPLFI